VSRARRRGNGEGSIYPVDGGYRGYVWVTGTDGIRRREYARSRPRLPKRRSSAWARASTARLLLHLLLQRQKKRPVMMRIRPSDLGGRYWDRTSDLLGVNEALSR
jgi:hypothetical protein